MPYQLTLLGTGTSQGVPVIGCDCPACRSRDPRDKRLRASALLELNTEGATPFRLQIDTGPDFRTQMLSAHIGELDAILLTHEHADHTNGLDDLRPICFRKRAAIPVYCLPRVAEDVRVRFAYAFGDYPEVPQIELHEKNFGDVLRCDGIDVELLEVHHGQLPIFGFRCGGLAYLTDAKTLPEATYEGLEGIETLVISSLHHSGTHSHLSLEESLAIAERVGAQRTVLTHFSHRMGPHAELASELPAGVEPGYDGLLLKC